MKGDFLFMGNGKKRAAPLWLVLTQGGLTALAVYFAGILVLSAMVVNGTVGEGSAWGVMVALGALAGFFGGVVAGRRTPWGASAAGMVVALIFAVAVGVAGLACWGEVMLAKRGILLAAAALTGGGAAGLLKRRRKGKRIKR